VLPVAKELSLSEDRIYLMKETGASKKLKTFRGIIQNVRKRKVPLVDIRPAGKDTLAYLVFSSGTSGLPKGMYIFAAVGLCQMLTNLFIYLAVMISHGNLIIAVAQIIVMVQVTSEVYTVCCIGILEILYFLNFCTSKIAPYAKQPGRSPDHACLLAAASHLWTTRV
jgi:acyl-coenzyme A synthetase/AMP-(fatty) acid ligase